MLIWEEFKKNFKFFAVMALVLVLLMSAGVSLFNFAFEINKRIYEILEENFDNGYHVRMDAFVSPDQKPDGADYIYADYSHKTVAQIPVPEDAPAFGLSTYGYWFEDHLPKGFVNAAEDYDGFLIDGRLWTAADNNKTDGKYPIFISDFIVYCAAEYGVQLTVGMVLSLTDRPFTSDIIVDDGSGSNAPQTDVLTQDFVITGIYKEPSWHYDVPDVIIPFAAEQEFSAVSGVPIEVTYAVLNTLEDFKAFSSYAKKHGIEYYAHFEEDMAVVAIFSTVFAIVSVLILVICGLVAYVYCGMHISRRINYIGIVKAMGLSSWQIAKQFFVMLLLILTVAFVLGNIFSIFLTAHFANLAEALLDYNLNTGFNLPSQMLFAALTVLSALLSAVLLAAKISKISISQTLTQRE